MKIIHQQTKTLVTRTNGRSADAISPNFVYGCLGGCMKSYCYVGRYNSDKVYVNTNTDKIIMSINDWVLKQQFPKIPNQIDDSHYTIDIGCSTDVPLMQKYYAWQEVFDYFNESSLPVKSTFATKYPSMFNPDKYILVPKRHRIRVSFMPQKYSSILEPNTDSIDKRIEETVRLSDKMETHINFSPIIYEEGWLDEYDDLFNKMKNAGINTKSECIFLTYNDISHKNASNEVNNLLWKPEIQEHKDSQYASDNIRYQWKLKSKMIEQFKELYYTYFDKDSIRYIF